MQDVIAIRQLYAINRPEQKQTVLTKWIEVAGLSLENS